LIGKISPQRRAQTAHTQHFGDTATVVTTVVSNQLIGAWLYPAFTNMSWDLESTTNFTTWIIEQTNCGPGDVFVRTTNKFKFFRMKAH